MVAVDTRTSVQNLTTITPTKDLSTTTPTSVSPDQIRESMRVNLDAAKKEGLVTAGEARGFLANAMADSTNLDKYSMIAEKLGSIAKSRDADIKIPQTWSGFRNFIIVTDTDIKAATSLSIEDRAKFADAAAQYKREVRLYNQFLPGFDSSETTTQYNDWLKKTFSDPSFEDKCRIAHSLVIGAAFTAQGVLAQADLLNLVLARVLPNSRDNFAISAHLQTLLGNAVGEFFSPEPMNRYKLKDPQAVAKMEGILDAFKPLQDIVQNPENLTSFKLSKEAAKQLRNCSTLEEAADIMRAAAKKQTN